MHKRIMDQKWKFLKDSDFFYSDFFFIKQFLRFANHLPNDVEKKFITIFLFKPYLNYQTN